MARKIFHQLQRKLSGCNAFTLTLSFSSVILRAEVENGILHLVYSESAEPSLYDSDKKVLVSQLAPLYAHHRFCVVEFDCVVDDHWSYLNTFEVNGHPYILLYARS